ncbi:MAG: superoxide dismutase [Bacteroidales bacterium]
MKKILTILLVTLGMSYNAHAQYIRNNDEVVKSTTIDQQAGKAEYKALPYSYDALEPYIDKETVEIHYSKHYKSYYNKFMAAVKSAGLDSMTIKDIFMNVSKYPAAVRNNGGGYYNHMLYFENIKPNSRRIPKGDLLTAINKTFGSFFEFKQKFSEAGKTRFGSGWAWLCKDEKGNLFICSTPNQDNPLMDIAEKKGTPLLVMDVWEHAYYLEYQNKRADYINAFWNIIDWNVVEKRFN